MTTEENRWIMARLRSARMVLRAEMCCVKLDTQHRRENQVMWRLDLSLPLVNDTRRL